MTGAHARSSSGRRGLIATAVTGLLAVSGVTCIAIALALQQHPAQPPLSMVGSHVPTTAATTSTSASVGLAVPVPLVVGLVLRTSAPVALKIPAIGVNSHVQLLGQNTDGSVQVPLPGSVHYNEAGWYRYSPAPGSLGPAIIVGHLDSMSGPSVFFRLGSLRKNDTVLVTRADGSVAVFAVDEVRRYAKAIFPTQLVYGDTNHAALRLITCGGPIDPATGHYRDNVVVLASLVNSVGGH
jgi:sortase (surface protein transpeptidase)